MTVGEKEATADGRAGRTHPSPTPTGIVNVPVFAAGSNVDGGRPGTGTFSSAQDTEDVTSGPTTTNTRPEVPGTGVNVPPSKNGTMPRTDTVTEVPAVSHTTMGSNAKLPTPLSVVPLEVVAGATSKVCVLLLPLPSSGNTKTDLPSTTPGGAPFPGGHVTSHTTDHEGCTYVWAEQPGSTPLALRSHATGAPVLSRNENAIVGHVMSQSPPALTKAPFTNVALAHGGEIADIYVCK